MKKILLIAAVASLSLASCKKDYVCECTISGSSGGLTLTNFPADSYKIKDTKKKAKDECTSKEEEDGGFKTTCTIK